MNARIATASLVTLLLPQALAPPERVMATFIDAHDGEALSLLERVVNINSGTQNLAGVRQVGGVLKTELDALGFKTQWVDGAEWHRAGHPGVIYRLLLSH